MSEEHLKKAYGNDNWESHKGETYKTLYQNVIMPNYYNEYAKQGDKLQFDCFDYALYGLINFASDYKLPVAFGSYDKAKQKFGIVTNSDKFKDGDWKGLHKYLSTTKGLNLGSKEAWKYALNSDWKGAFTKVKIGKDNKESIFDVRSGDLHLFNHHTWVAVGAVPNDKASVFQPKFQLMVVGGNQYNGLTKTPLMMQFYNWDTIKNNLNSRGDKDDSIFATWHFDNFDKSFKK